MRSFAAALALVVLGACEEAPSPAEIAAADYGRPMAQGECEVVARAALLGILRDPGSAQFRFGACERWAGVPAFYMNLPRQYGYAVPVEVNARNGFGGYTGFQPYIIAMRDGAVIRREEYDPETRQYWAF